MLSILRRSWCTYQFSTINFTSRACWTIVRTWTRQCSYRRNTPNIKARCWALDPKATTCRIGPTSICRCSPGWVTRTSACSRSTTNRNCATKSSRSWMDSRWSDCISKWHPRFSQTRRRENGSLRYWTIIWSSVNWTSETPLKIFNAKKPAFNEVNPSFSQLIPTY